LSTAALAVLVLLCVAPTNAAVLVSITSKPNAMYVYLDESAVLTPIIAENTAAPLWRGKYFNPLHADDDEVIYEYYHDYLEINSRVTEYELFNWFGENMYSDYAQSLLGKPLKSTHYEKHVQYRPLTDHLYYDQYTETCWHNVFNDYCEDGAGWGWYINTLSDRYRGYAESDGDWPSAYLKAALDIEIIESASTIAPVPLPMSGLLLLTGLPLLGLASRRRGAAALQRTHSTGRRNPQAAR
jgi:hypothetical protein